MNLFTYWCFHCPTNWSNYSSQIFAALIWFSNEKWKRRSWTTTSPTCWSLVCNNLSSLHSCTFVLMALIELTLLLLDYYPRRVQFIYITLINTKWAQMLIKEIHTYIYQSFIYIWTFDGFHGFYLQTNSWKICLKVAQRIVLKLHRC